MKRKILSTMLLTTGLVITGLTSCGSEVDPLADGVLTIGLECAYAPFNYTEYSKNDFNEPIKGTNNEYCAGYDILIARKIAEDLGVRLEVVRCEWDGLIPQVQLGSIDAIIAGMTDTANRRNAISFTDEYYASQLVIVTRNSEDLSSYTQISDFRGKKFVAQMGTVQADLINTYADSESEDYAGIIASNHTTTYPEAFIALEAGTVDCVVCEQPVAQDYLSSHLEFSQVVLDDENFIVSVSIGISKNTPSSYLEALNNSLKKISQEERTRLMNYVTQGN